MKPTQQISRCAENPNWVTKKFLLGKYHLCFDFFSKLFRGLGGDRVSRCARGIGVGVRRGKRSVQTM